MNLRRGIALALALGACSPPEAPALPLAFTDVTTGSGLDVTITSGANPPTQILEVKGGGLALLDRDGDGDLDVLVPNGATLDRPSEGPGAALFDNLSSPAHAGGRGELRFERAAVPVDFDRWGMGLAVGDVDSDGDQDAFVACFGPDALLENRGAEGFVDSGAERGLAHDAWGMAAAFGDLDLDGDLDLYVANYLEFDPANPPPRANFLGVPVFGGPRPLPPLPDVAYRNDDGTFVRVTEESGLAAAPSYGLGVLIADLDHDGDQDVFVGNDSMNNFLFANDGAWRFNEKGLPSGVACDADGNAQATMGIALADVDGNGFGDLFTTNFQGDSNTLHENRGGLRFVDSTASWGLGVVSRNDLGWAALFGDYDHDGDEDLVVVNGHTYGDAEAAQMGSTRRQLPRYFERVPDGFETLDAARGGAWLERAICGRGGAQGDLDGDGDLDLVLAELGGPVRVLRNDATLGRGLVVELEGEPGNLRALGARVVVRFEDRELTRWIHHGGGFQSVGAPSAHFGLPRGVEDVEVEVVWPDGTVTSTPVEKPVRVAVESAVRLRIGAR